MASASSLPPAPHVIAVGRVRGLVTAAIGTIVFLTVVDLISRGLRLLVECNVGETLRSRTALTIGGSALGEFNVLLLLTVFLHTRGRSLRDLGISQKSSMRGWILAGLMTALYVSVVFTSVLRNQSGMGEMSLFRISTSLAAGLSAGSVEEIFFRGFIMNQLEWSGFGPTGQAILSGVCFGVAHVGWGLLAAKPQIGMAAGAMVTTSVLGILYGLVYLSSRRSLLPVILGHGLMDLLIEPWLVMSALGAATAHLH